ncbi:MAG: beta-N-acetylhexosaminidase [Alphaproteobacteria bacterium]
MSPDERSRAQAGLNETAAIVGVAGPVLDDEERKLFARCRPAGFILFARNCETPEQVTALVRDLRLAAGNAEAPVLIDQEGGRVARLKPPHWPARPPLRRIGELAERDLEAGIEAAWLHARLIAADLLPLGITVNCSPVLDLGLPGQTEAIGDRAFAADPELVGTLGRSTIEGYLAGGVLPVIKHLPGHGRAMVDSHADLPCVSAGVGDLGETDWRPFVANADAPLGMTAHILFERLDSAACATQSPRIIREIIRGEIGFEGALLSDDLSMQALGGGLGERTAAARRAGCDLALHCNGVLAEMTAVLEAAGPLDGVSLARFERALARRRAAEPFDPGAGEDRLRHLLGEVSV